jgi:hypothetical protein
VVMGNGMDQVPLDREAAKGTKSERMWETPSHWPRSIRFVPNSDFDFLGLDPKTMQLYWDGQEIVTRRRLSDFERMLAIFALGLTAGGVAATVVQAVAAVMAL